MKLTLCNTLSTQKQQNFIMQIDKIILVGFSIDTITISDWKRTIYVMYDVMCLNFLHSF